MTGYTPWYNPDVKKGKESNLAPLGRRVIVRPDPQSDSTAGGIIVEGKRQDPSGTVEAVGGEVELVAVGDRVLFSPFHYEEVPGGRYVIDERDLWARIP